VQSEFRSIGRIEKYEFLSFNTAKNDRFTRGNYSVPVVSYLKYLGLIISEKLHKTRQTVVKLTTVAIKRGYRTVVPNGGGTSGYRLLQFIVQCTNPTLVPSPVRLIYLPRVTPVKSIGAILDKQSFYCLFLSGAKILVVKNLEL